MSRYYRTLLATLGDNFLTNLVAYYAFENNANDSLGINNGSETRVLYATGINGDARDYSNDNLIRLTEVSDSDDFTFSTTTNDLPFSISLWANFTSFSVNSNYLINKRASTGSGITQEWEFFRDSSNNKITINLFNQGQGTSFITALSNDITTTGVWFHIVVTYDGSSNQSGLNIYINGSLNVSSRTQTGTYVRMNNTKSAIRMCQPIFNSTDVSFKHRGLLDEVAVWKNRELTSTEVTELYNAGVGKFYPF
jgi:hypothetical protein